MDNKRISDIFEEPHTACDLDICDMMKELQRRLNKINTIVVQGEMKDCKKQYSELLQLIGAINDIFTRDK